jgi:cytochrome c553
MAIACCAVAAPAAAQSLEGRLLAAQCAQCHGTNGRAVAGFEDLAGKNALEMYEELLEMKYRPTAESIMDRQAKGYTEEQLRAIADYFASLPPGDD